MQKRLAFLLITGVLFWTGCGQHPIADQVAQDVRTEVKQVSDRAIGNACSQIAESLLDSIEQDAEINLKVTDNTTTRKPVAVLNDTAPSVLHLEKTAVAPEHFLFETIYVLSTIDPEIVACMNQSDLTILLTEDIYRDCYDGEYIDPGEGRTIVGAMNGNRNTMYLLADPEQDWLCETELTETIIHETGHFVSDVLGYVDGGEPIPENDLAGISVASNDIYCFTSIEEAYAEAFAAYYLNPTVLAANAPTTYLLINSDIAKIKELYPI